jgi:NMD protein affecting ribosome stability and mRNA decay
MNCRDCFKELDPLTKTMEDRVCNSCSDKNEEFWNSIIKLLEDSYSEV